MKSLICVLLLVLATNAYAQETVQQKNIVDQLIRLLGLQDVWDIIVSVGGTYVTQLIQIFTRLLFAGSQVLAQVQQIASQLVDDLLGHVGNAADTIQSAINAMLSILNGSGKRELIDIHKDMILSKQEIFRKIFTIITQFANFIQHNKTIVIEPFITEVVKSIMDILYPQV